MISKYLWAFLLMLVPAFLFAQNVPYTVPATVVLTGPRFFVALISGLILALAFQLVLTNLSAAAGLSVLGSATSPKNLNREKGGEKEKEGSSGVQSTVRKISSAFGIWALITASVSLFFASWFAASLGVAVGAATGALLGLTIWGLFYLVTMSIEATAVSSMVGALSGIVKNSFKATSNAVSSVFGKSPENQAAESAARITAAVREELFGSQADLRKQLQNYVTQLKPQLTPEQLGGEIASS
jgi:ABC-type multidrug transport system fused ATPase/permease subunit